MSHAAPTSPVAIVDARPIAPLHRHAQVVQAFGALRNGQAMELLNDHDPKPLRYRFQTERPGEARWDEVECGPDVWRVRITRLPDASERSCCGACGGA